MNPITSYALSKKYTDKKASAFNGSPKGTYPTLTDLQTAYPTGSDGVYLVTADGHWYFWNGVSWVSGGVYQATGINATIASVSRNIFDKTKIIEGKEVYNDGSYKNESNSIVAYSLDVEGFANIVISGLPTYADGLNNRFLFFYDANDTPLGELKTISRSVSQASFPVPIGAKIVSFSVKQRSTVAVNLDTIQVEEGTIPTEYQPFQKGITKLDGIPFKATFVDPTPPKTSLKKLLAFGDSITETATINEDGTGYTEGTRSNWLTHAKDILKLGEIRNYARSGASYKDQNVAGDIRKSISQQVNMAIESGFSPDIIVAAAGTNDGNVSLGDYTTAMNKSSLEELDRSLLYEAIRWTFWTLRLHYPDAMCYASTPIQRANKEQPQELIDAIVKMARRYDFIIIDAHNESGIVRDFEVQGAEGRDLIDGLHPKISGQQKMAKLCSRVILNSHNF